MDKEFKISKRAYNWSLEVFIRCRKIQRSDESRVVRNQLLRSASSVAANLAEADCCLSKKDFIKCVGIALKECNESKVWISYLRDLNLVEIEAIKELLLECDQISRILASIILKAKDK